MTKSITLNLDVKIRWWFKIYIKLLTFFCVLFNQVPDKTKLDKWINLGVAVNIKK